MVDRVVQVRRLGSRAAFDAHLARLGVELPVGEPGAVLAGPLERGGFRLANRFAVLPMEGWDGTDDGRPTDLVRRRWSRFGASGAGLVWGGEAVAVRTDGRANARQLSFGPHAEPDLAELRGILLDAHAGATGGGPPPVLGLQLTHSGRWSRPSGAPQPLVAYRHPLLDRRVGVDDDRAVVSDGWLDDLAADFVAAARVAREAGFDFVDVKHCHGYLLHELLSAVDRPGRYGGDLDGRLRFLTTVTEGIQREAPGLGVAVRLSAFDVVPHVAGPDGVGVPEHEGPYRYAFGGDGTGLGIDLREVHELCTRLTSLGIRLLCVTAGSPYYCPHVQRPAYFPPSDGYQPPRDPLVDVAHLVEVCGAVTAAHPELVTVLSGVSYLQEWLPAVAAGAVSDGVADVVGYGRGVLSYPELPLAAMAAAPPERSKLCRTFSDCTTAPRHGLVSGCYPLDPVYKERPERAELAGIKKRQRT